MTKLVAVAIFCLWSCLGSTAVRAAVDTDMQFDAQSTDALLIVGSYLGVWSDDGVPNVTFQRVDMAAGRFLENGAYILLSGMRAERLKPVHAPPHYYIARVPAGDYAFTGKTGMERRKNIFGISSDKYTHTCFSKSAAVFHFEPGKIYWVPVNNVEYSSDHLKAVLAQYTHVQAQTDIAQITSHVSFDTKHSFMVGLVCGGAGDSAHVMTPEEVEAAKNAKPEN